MNEQYWNRLQDAFTKLAELPPNDQGEGLRELLRSDPLIAEDVRELLEEDAFGHGLPDAGLQGLLGQALEREPLDLPAHFQIGPYRLLRLLGEGGMGVVYLAEREDIAGSVAIKLLRDAWLSPVRRQRFAVEQQTMGRLNHPSIARIYDAGTTQDGTPWFAMEFADGETISEYLRNKHLTEYETIRLFRSVCDTVRFAHSHAIIHRDLKPSNIIVTEDGRVKLLDFGIAKQMDLLKQGTAMTTSGWRLFTPAYAAPELQNGNEVGVFTDVYSLGVILYELLTGILPDTEGKTTNRGAHRPSRQVTSENKNGLSKSEWADLDAICCKSLAPEVSSRYGSIDALISDVDAFLSCTPVSARQGSFWYTAQKFARRRRVALLSTALVLLVIVSVTVVFTIRLARARDAAARARDAAVAEAAHAEHIQQFTETLFTGGAGHGTPPPGIRVTEMLDREKSEALQEAGDPALRMAMFRILGTAYADLGRYSDAEPLLRKAQQASCGSGPSLECADIEIPLGQVMSTHGSWLDQETLIRDALRRKQQALPPNDPAIADVLLDLGDTLVNEQENAEAKLAYTKAFAIASEAGHPSPQLARAMGAVAIFMFAYNDPRMFDLEERSAEMTGELFGRSSTEYAASEYTLGTISMNLGRYDQSEQYYRRALAASQAWSGPDEGHSAMERVRLGLLLTLRGKYREATGLELKALALNSRYGGITDVERGAALFTLGFAALKQGRLDDAEQYFGTVVLMDRQGKSLVHADVQDSQLGLAKIYARRGDFQQSEREARSVIATPRQGAPYVPVAAHAILGHALLEEGRVREADAELEQAHAWFAHDPAIRPETVPTYLDLAEAKSRLGDASGAARVRAERRAHFK